MSIALACLGPAWAMPLPASPPSPLDLFHAPLPVAAARPPRIRADYGRLPLVFEPNRGQADARFQFVGRGGGALFLLKPDQAALAFCRDTAPARTPGERPFRAAPSWRVDTLRLGLVGADASVRGLPQDPLPGKSSYFLGPDPSRWVRGVAQYGGVGFDGVYPGVGVRYYGNRGRLEYDFSVDRGADERRIAWSVRGASRTRVDAQGGLALDVGGRAVRFLPPLCYDRDDPSRRFAGRYEIRPDGTVGFAVPGRGRGTALVIDPTLDYSTFLGGDLGEDTAYGVAADAAGDAYVTGTNAIAGGFPLADAYQTAPGSIYVAELNPEGSALVYSTYLGGTGAGWAGSLAVDGAGNAYITGYAGSGFPTTPGAFQTAWNGTGNDTIVAKLSAGGDNLDYATYLGSPGSAGVGIAVDAGGNAYVAGTGAQGNIPATAGSFQTSYTLGGWSGFAFKLNATGAALDYCTYLNGTASADVGGIAVDAAGDAYVVGACNPGFPTTPGSFQSVYAGVGAPYDLSDAFVCELNPSGNSLLYATYLGGASGSAWASGVAVDGSGDAVVTGYTSGDFPVTAGAVQASYGAGALSNAFVAKLNPQGSGLLYSTYLGGDVGENGTLWGGGVALDGSGDAFVTGSTNGGFPVTADAYQAAYGGAPQADVYVSELSPDGGLLYSTYLGGSTDNFGDAVAVDPSGDFYVAGVSDYGDFPTTAGAFETADPDSVYDQTAFVAKFDVPAAPAPSPTPSPTATSAPSQTPTATPTRTPPDTATPSPTPPPPLALTPHYPNPDPGNGSGIWLPYSINTAAAVTVTLYDVSGEVVRRWSPVFEEAGDQQCYWDTRNGYGRAAASGVYLALIQARSPSGDTQEAWEKCALVR